MTSADLTPAAVRSTLEKLTGLEVRGAISAVKNANGGIAYKVLLGPQTLLATRMGDGWMIALGDHVAPAVLWTTMMSQAQTNSGTLLVHILNSLGLPSEAEFIVERRDIKTDVLGMRFSTGAGSVWMYTRRIDAGTEVIVDLVDKKCILRYLHRRDGTIDLDDVKELRSLPF